MEIQRSLLRVSSVRDVQVLPGDRGEYLSIVGFIVSSPSRLVVKSVGFLEDHADVVQAGDEADAVDFLAAAGTVAEADDVGAVLA